MARLFSKDRLRESGSVEQKLTQNFSDSSSTFDADGYLTSYTANSIEISSITYETVNGVSADFGGTYRRVTGWTEKDLTTNNVQNITVTYGGTGRVSSLTIT